MNGLKMELYDITQVLLKPDDNFEEITPAINNLNKLFLDLTNLDLNESRNRENIYLPNGKAIGTSWAAMCLKEILRTKYFIRGFYKAIKAAQKKFPNQKINILYAGTGPFATLAIPLTSIFSSAEISFTFLEINPESINLLEKIIEKLEIEQYIKKIVMCDAAKYIADEDTPIHMIITETMQNALQKEPQAAITMNLVPQMVDGGILIPQNINITAGIMNEKLNTERMLDSSGVKKHCYHTLGSIFELNKNITQVEVKSNIPNSKDLIFPSIELEIPKNLEPGYNKLYLFTAIQVFEDVVLTDWQCSLNIPKKIMDITPQPIEKISFQYIISDKPGFIYSINP
jgi:predicted RNA methylase